MPWHLSVDRTGWISDGSMLLPFNDLSWGSQPCAAYFSWAVSNWLSWGSYLQLFATLAYVTTIPEVAVLPLLWYAQRKVSVFIVHWKPQTNWPSNFHMDTNWFQLIKSIAVFMYFLYCMNGFEENINYPLTFSVPSTTHPYLNAFWNS